LEVLVFVPIITGLGVFVVIGLIGLIVLHRKGKQKEFQALLTTLASERGFTYEAGTFWHEAKATGVVDGREVVVDAVNRQAGKSTIVYSRVQLNSPDLPQNLVLKAEGMGTNLWKMVAGSDEVLGDESFDDQVLVRGDEADATAILDEQTRGIIAAMIEGKIKLENGRLYFEQVNYFETQEEIDGIIDLMNQAAKRLRVSGRPREDKLLENIREDSDPEVRARNLAMLALHHRHSNLIELALAAVLGAKLSSSDERGMLQVLSRAPAAIDQQAAAAIALGRSASGAAVPVLREWAAEIDGELDFLKRLVHQSVAAIQQRIGSVDGGGLSMVQGSVGALSEAEGVGGELSVAEQEVLRKKQGAAQKGRQGQG
jgi:hypothetical protein